MGKIGVDYLTWRGPEKRRRYYFQPQSVHRGDRWKAVRLRDQHGYPLTDRIVAAASCKACADIYKRWCAGDRTVGPDWIDENGRVRDPATIDQVESPSLLGQSLFTPGTVGAIIADYKTWVPTGTVVETQGRRAGKVRKGYGQLADNTRRTYDDCLDLLQAAWGDRAWSVIDEAQARKWVVALMEEAPFYGHYVMRVARAVFGMTRFVYTKSHPGYIPLDSNPFRALAVPTPESEILPWPGSLIRPYVAFLDAAGRPSMGDYVLFNSWLGQRINDMLAVPVDRFSVDLPLWIAQSKTGRDVVLPWALVPELQTRFAEAEVRRKARKVTATTFFYDDKSGKPFQEDHFRHLHAELRAGFSFLLMCSRTDRTARWKCDFAAKHFEDDPFAVDVSRLEIRTLRATAVTLMHDADLDAGTISAVTGHSEDTVQQILRRHYRKLTATQAGRAFKKRLKMQE